MKVKIIHEDSKGVKIFTAISGNSTKQDHDFARFRRGWRNKFFTLTARPGAAKISLSKRNGWFAYQYQSRFAFACACESRYRIALVFTQYT